MYYYSSINRINIRTYIICHISYVICHISYIIYQMYACYMPCKNIFSSISVSASISIPGGWLNSPLLSLTSEIDRSGRGWETCHGDANPPIFTHHERIFPSFDSWKGWETFLSKESYLFIVSYANFLSYLLIGDLIDLSNLGYGFFSDTSPKKGPWKSPPTSFIEGKDRLSRLDGSAAQKIRFKIKPKEISRNCSFKKENPEYVKSTKMIVDFKISCQDHFITTWMCFPHWTSKLSSPLPPGPHAVELQEVQEVQVLDFSEMLEVPVATLVVKSTIFPWEFPWDSPIGFPYTAAPDGEAIHLLAVAAATKRLSLPDFRGEGSGLEVCSCCKNLWRYVWT